MAEKKENINRISEKVQRLKLITIKNAKLII